MATTEKKGTYYKQRDTIERLKNELWALGMKHETIKTDNQEMQKQYDSMKVAYELMKSAYDSKNNRIWFWFGAFMVVSLWSLVF